jgi:hypothetical protein
VAADPKDDLNQWLNDLVDPAKCRIDPAIAKALVRWVTPEDAEEWIARLPPYQRNIKSRSMEEFVTDMQEGYWIDGVPVIAFNRDGELINGHHVLGAFLKAKLAKILCIVVVNCDPNAYLGYDLGIKRSLADNLKGETDSPAQVGKVLNVLRQWDLNEYEGRGYMTAREGTMHLQGRRGREFLAKHPGIEGHLFPNPFRTNAGYRSVAAMHAASYRLHQIDPETAQKFFHCFVSGADMPAGHPVLVLRGVFQNMDKDMRWRSGPTLAHVITAWNLFVAKSKVAAGRWPFRMGQSSFPEIAVPLPVPESSRSGKGVN